MRAVLVSHTHWDREWYRTFQAFRARLVDAVDRLLELCARDPEYRFLLDGQSIVLEDYLAVRPERRGDLEELVRAGRIAIGPWYVQPDSLLPAGEAHVRNLLEGRRVAETFGPCSRMGYPPDSFGHPAQLPQLLRGFGIETFVYWRGNGDEIDELPSEYQWEAPDGTRVLACHLARGYFAAAQLPEDPERAAEQLEQLGRELAERASGGRVLLPNGVDHQLPDAHVRAAAEALAKRTGWEVVRGLLDDFTGGVPAAGLPVHRGELVGGRAAPLLPGVWSTRSALKLANRACEAALLGWAEPFAAVALASELPDERAALRAAWRELLPNQAHDSICGCSRDAVHEQMGARYDAARELADETRDRILGRLAGLPVGREVPWSDALDLAVFNPSPHPRSDVVRFALDPEPAIRRGAPGTSALHPLLAAALPRAGAEPGALPGFEVDGAPARVSVSAENGRFRVLAEAPALDVEFPVRDVPALGWKRVRLRPARPAPETRDPGREIAAGDVRVAARDDGTLDVGFGALHFAGQAALEDAGDRGDSYDFDPAPGGRVALEGVEVERRRHPSGIEILRVARRLRVPAALREDGSRRSRRGAVLRVELEARVVPGVSRVDLEVRVDNTARDHRLRLLFPTGGPVQRFRAASTFDVAERTPGARPDHGWVCAAPRTFVQQGFVHAGGLTVVAPGLAEAEVDAAGAIALTLLRAVGWISRARLGTRPQPAGPAVPVPGAQVPGPLLARLALLPGFDPRAAQAAELGLRAVVAGAEPRVPAGRALLALEPPELLLSAWKPAEEGRALLLRVLNPGDETREARVALGVPVARARAVRLDETPCDEPVSLEGAQLRFPVPPHALRSVRLEL